MANFIFTLIVKFAARAIEGYNEPQAQSFRHNNRYIAKEVTLIIAALTLELSDSILKYVSKQAGSCYYTKPFYNTLTSAYSLWLEIAEGNYNSLMLISGTLYTMVAMIHAFLKVWCNYHVEALLPKQPQLQGFVPFSLLNPATELSSQELEDFWSLPVEVDVTMRKIEVVQQLPLLLMPAVEVGKTEEFDLNEAKRLVKKLGQNMSRVKTLLNSKAKGWNALAQEFMTKAEEGGYPTLKAYADSFILKPRS